MRLRKLLIFFLSILIFYSNQTEPDEGLCPISQDNSKTSCGAEANKVTDQQTGSSSQGADKKNEDELLVEEVPKEEPKKQQQQQEPKQVEKPVYRSKSNKKTEETTTETIEYPDDLVYQELFQRPGERYKYLTSFTFKSNYTEYYDFNIDDEELDSIKKARITIYPPKKFQLNHQGNFLHFYKVAYEKKLPVYFTVDSMLYAVNENINRLNMIYYEEILIYYLRHFLINTINYANDLMDSAEGEPHRYMISHAQLYFAVALELLSEGYEKHKYNSIIDTQVTNFIAKIKKYEVAEFFMFYSKRKINCSFLLPSGFFTRSKKLQNIHHTLKWFVSTRFLIDKKEISPIWYIGKLIHDSGNLEVYNKIFETLSYIQGQDSITPSIVDIYKIGLEMGYKDVFDLSEEQSENLIKKSLEKKNIINLPFLNDNFFAGKAMLEAFRIEREFTTFLFTYHFDVEDWVKNKLILYDPRIFRIMMSSFEITASIHHATAFKQIIFNRYKGKKTMGEGEDLIPLRDGIDLTEYFEKAKYSIKDSMNDHPENWRKSIINHMHLILYKASRRIKLYDPLYKMPFYKQKNFYTAYAGYVHFKREFAIMKNLPEVSKKEGKFADVVIEPNLGFYEEILELANNYKNMFNDMKKFAELNMGMNSNPAFSNFRFSFVNLQGIIRHLIDVIEMLIDGIKKQESGKMDQETLEQISDIISFNKQYNTWTGWYIKLLDPNNYEDAFNFYSWTAKVHASPPIEEKQFNGAIFYTNIHYPFIGLVVKEDKFTKKRKLLLFSGYNAKETTKRFDPKVNFDDEIEAIKNRD